MSFIGLLSPVLLRDAGRSAHITYAIHACYLWIENKPLAVGFPPFVKNLFSTNIDSRLSIVSALGRATWCAMARTASVASRISVNL